MLQRVPPWCFTTIPLMIVATVIGAILWGMFFIAFGAALIGGLLLKACEQYLTDNHLSPAENTMYSHKLDHELDLLPEGETLEGCLTCFPGTGKPMPKMP